jgi:hypothetical protein
MSQGEHEQTHDADAEIQPLGYLEGTRTEKYLSVTESLFESHTMSKQEAAYFRREMASAWVPLTREQTRVLPQLKKWRAFEDDTSASSVG